MKLKKNIIKDYYFTFSSRLDLTQGVWMLYLATRGLTLFQIGLLETVYHISSFLMEIPTGAIADIYGRRVSRILSRIVAAVSIIIMIYADNFYMFGLSFVFMALSNNLESGAGDALIYDSLIELKIEGSYSRIKGKNEFVYQLTKVLAYILGGYIATKSYLDVYRLSLLISAITIIQALFFMEPTVGTVKRSHNFLTTFSKQIKDSFIVIKNDKCLFEIILFFELFSTFYVTEFFYLQNRLKNLGKSELYIGIVLSMGALVAAIIATKTHTIEKRYGLKRILTIGPIIAIFSFIGMGIKGFEVYSFIILSGVEGILYVSLSDYLNSQIPSEQRATIISVQSMAFSFFMIILFPIIGKIGDLYNLNIGFRIIAFFSTISLVAMVYLVRRGKRW